MKKVKRSFTLLETLIAMSLTIAILSAVLFFYRQIQELTAKSEALQRQGFEQRYLENRLSTIFPLTANAKQAKKNFYFFTFSDPGGIFKANSAKSLFFSFDNRINIDKQITNLVLGELYLDPQENLCLAIWPAPSRWQEGTTPTVKKEVLLRQVDSLTFSFFVPPENKKPVAPISANETIRVATTVVKPLAEGSWVTDWSQDYQFLPGLVKLEIKRKGKIETYIFPLPHTDRQVVYRH